MKSSVITNSKCTIRFADLNLFILDSSKTSLDKKNENKFCGNRSNLSLSRGHPKLMKLLSP